MKPNEDDFTREHSECCRFIWNFDQAVSNLHITRHWNSYFGVVDLLTMEICKRLRE